MGSLYIIGLHFALFSIARVKRKENVQILLPRSVHHCNGILTSGKSKNAEAFLLHFFHVAAGPFFEWSFRFMKLSSLADLTLRPLKLSPSFWLPK